MDITSLVVFLAVGAIAGWLAGLIMKSKKSSLLENMIIGVVGAFIGGFVFGALGISAGGLLGSIITATAGAALLIVIVRAIR